MTALATRISKELTKLPTDEQAAVLREVKERLEDLRARKAYDSYLSGKSKARDLETSLAELERETAWLEEPDAFSDLWKSLAAVNTASPKVWMDAYLAAFAIGHRIRFVTLDSDFRKYEANGLILELLTL